MLSTQAREILDKYQVRKSSKEKREFRAWLRSQLEAAGWPTAEEGSFLSGHNVIAGDPDKAKVFFTAHYDTQAVLPIPNFITPRSMGWYLAYQLLLIVPMILAVALVEGLVIALAPKELLPVLAPLASALLCGFFVWWMFFGKANRHTANDNTSGVITLLEIALAMPAQDRDKVCIIFFDNEERGMLGSSDFAGKHKAVKKDGLVLNFDCVSDGDSIQFFPTKALKKEKTVLDLVENAFRLAGKERQLFDAQPGGEKEVEVVRGFGFYPSDNASFKRACGVCALKYKKPFGYYMDRIHTGKDTVFMEENIALLRDGCLRLAKELEA